jgi:signal transduction histidine kinase
MALYLPQENVISGQLEFTPVVLYPDPNTERVFIASDAASGQAPTLPKTLTKLPGFAHATTLLPGYPMISSSKNEVTPAVGVVEEVMCDTWFKSRLSVPLLSGSQTVGVLLVSPAGGSDRKEKTVWTQLDREQVSLAAQTLSMALSMDNERKFLREQNAAFQEGLSDSLHQVKNPLQALRTYGKILQRQIADNQGGTPQLLELTERMMVQSDRVVDLMIPMDTLVDTLSRPSPLALNPAKSSDYGREKLVLWEEPPKFLPWENETLEFARENGSVTECASQRSNMAMPTTNVKRSPTTAAAAPWKSKRSSTKKKEPPTPSSTVVGDLETEMTFVTDVLEPIFSAFQAIASERRIYFEVIEETNELPGVIAAPRSLQEAVSNVLDNAFKYVGLPKTGSPFLKNPSPRVRVRMLANEELTPAGVTLLIEDNGTGIRDQDKVQIFQRGYRSPDTNSVDGTGIGLDISQALMQRMGGVLEVAEPDEFQNCLDGAVIKFTLFRKPVS